MSNEHSPTPAAEAEKQLKVDGLVQRMKDRLAGQPIASPRFQAFADVSDRISAEELVRRTDTANENYPAFVMKRALIYEAIRQKENGMPSYKREYRHTEEWVRELGEAKRADMATGAKPDDVENIMGRLKNVKILESEA